MGIEKTRGGLPDRYLVAGVDAVGREVDVVPAIREKLMVRRAELLGSVDHEIDYRVVIVFQKLRADGGILEIRLEVTKIRVV